MPARRADHAGRQGLANQTERKNKIPGPSAANHDSRPSDAKPRIVTKAANAARMETAAGADSPLRCRRKVRIDNTVGTLRANASAVITTAAPTGSPARVAKVTGSTAKAALPTSSDAAARDSPCASN